MEALATNPTAVRASLQNGGLQFIATSLKLREKFIEYLQTAWTKKYVQCVERIGWHNGSYVLPNKTFGTESNEEIVYLGTSSSANYKIQGGILDWILSFWPAASRRSNTPDGDAENFME